jgi:hypothetical protein
MIVEEIETIEATVYVTDWEITVAIYALFDEALGYGN